MLFAEFIMMVAVALVTMLIMAVIFKYLDKCYRTLKKRSQRVNFACWITVAMWVVLAFILNAAVC